MPIVVVLVLYTLLVGWALLAKIVQPDSGYLLTAIPCLVPAGWYCYGYFNAERQVEDQGLLFSAVGWGLLAVACYIRYSNKVEVLVRQPNSAIFVKMTRSATSSPTANLCGVLAVICLLLGAIVSWYAWQHESTK